MAIVDSVPLPKTSALTDLFSDGDFLDCYAGKAQIAPRRAAGIIVNFPSWARMLLLIRRIVTSPFGLSQEGPDAKDKIGPFPVEQETEHELIAGFDDRHLNFRISVMHHEGKIHLATWVRPHNFGGRLYLNLIMPFHIMIARNGIARAMKAAGTQQTIV